MDQHKRNKFIKVADNVNLANNSVITTPTVATEAYVNEIIIIGCLETNSLVCELGCMKVYKSRNASHNMSKRKDITSSRRIG